MPMKIISTLFFLCCCIALFAQEDKLRIQGKVVNKNGDPISDVYIINTSNHEKDITQPNGIFTITVSPNDSLILSHISYFRKSVKIFTLLRNPVIILESENIEIPEITVSPNQTNDLENAKQNLLFLNDYQVPKYNKMKPEIDPLQTIMTEHNRLMRTEAGSISFLPILEAPLKLLDKSVQKRKRRKLYSTDYSSSRKQKDLTPEE